MPLAVLGPAQACECPLSHWGLKLFRLPQTSPDCVVPGGHSVSVNPAIFECQPSSRSLWVSMRHALFLVLTVTPPPLPPLAATAHWSLFPVSVRLLRSAPPLEEHGRGLICARICRPLPAISPAATLARDAGAWLIRPCSRMCSWPDLLRARPGIQCLPFRLSPGHGCRHGEALHPGPGLQPTLDRFFRPCATPSGLVLSRIQFLRHARWVLPVWLQLSILLPF